MHPRPLTRRLSWCLEQMRKRTRYQDVVRSIVRSLHSSIYKHISVILLVNYSKEANPRELIEDIIIFSLSIYIYIRVYIYIYNLYMYTSL